MRVPAWIVLVALSGCASVGVITMPNGARCTRPTVDFDETVKSQGRTEDGFAAFEFTRTTRKSGSIMGQGKYQSKREYASKIACIRGAQAVAFKACVDFGNGLRSEDEFLKIANSAYGRCGERYQQLDFR